MRRISFILLFVCGFLSLALSQEHDEEYYELGYNLLYMADSGSVSDVKTLIDTRGAEVNFYNEDGVTALMLASQAGHDTVVSFLISRGAEINAKSLYFGYTALISAVRNDYLKTAEKLIRSGAIIDQQDAFMRTALHYASMYGYDATADMLLYYEASTETKDNIGYTPLCYAVEEKFDSLTNILLDFGARTDLFVKDSFDLFQIAAGVGNLYFLERFKDGLVLRINNDSLTAVDIATVAGHSDVLSWFIANGFLPTDTICNIYTPRTLARSSGDRKTKKVIRKMGFHDIHYPYFRRIGMGYDFVFNGDDFFMSLSGVLADDRYGFILESGILFRPGERSILFPIDTNEFYQLREKRYGWYFSVKKHFKIFSVGLNSYCSLFGGLRSTYYWGEHDGVSTPVLKEMIPSPIAGINYNFSDEFRAYFYCDYLNMGIYGTPAMFYSIGMSALVDFRKKDTNEKYKYIIKY
ncbi:MAG: ankyrin repeat domain-containing protein [Bacteroidales bacterium]|nr:ankyrin repeat domain-containing protein [Bacteroidales bacterium]